MERTRHTMHGIYQALQKKRTPFLLSFVLAFLMTYGLLYSIDFVPEPPAEDSSMRTASTQPRANLEVGLVEAVDDRPLRIIADAIDLDATIVNPESENVAVLDEALRHGVVHYPGSGDLSDHSNMLLFGHSSGLPNVQNEWYKIFNNLSRLSPGDVVRIHSAGHEYRYVVTDVRLVDAEEELVELSTREKKLTISTCNSFGAKSERFVVEADYLGRVELGQRAVTGAVDNLSVLM